MIKTEILPKVNGSPEWKKKCNAVKRQVTPKVGQITNDRQAILRIVRRPLSLSPTPSVTTQR